MSPLYYLFTLFPDYPTKKCNGRTRPNFFLSCVHLDLYHVLRTNTNAAFRCTRQLNFARLLPTCHRHCAFLPRLPSRAKSIVLGDIHKYLLGFAMRHIPLRWNESRSTIQPVMIHLIVYLAYRTAHGCPIPHQG